MFFFQMFTTLRHQPVGGGTLSRQGPKPDPLAVLATDAEMASWAGAVDLRDEDEMDGMVGTEKNH